MQPKVVVTGLGVVSPLGNDVPTFWQGICQGRSGITKITRFDTEGLASKIAGMVEEVVPEGMGSKDLRRESQYSIYAIEAADQAVTHSGIDLEAEDSFRCGAVIGSGIGGLDINAFEPERLPHQAIRILQLSRGHRSD